MDSEKPYIYTVFIRDTKTNTAKRRSEAMSLAQWKVGSLSELDESVSGYYSFGNGSCDCNRSLWFSGRSVKCGDTRFRVKVLRGDLLVMDDGYDAPGLRVIEEEKNADAR